MSEYAVCSITAKVHILSEEQGGRSSYFVVGGTKYRPQFRLDRMGPTSSCFIDRAAGKDRVSPGETVNAEMTLLHPEYFPDRLVAGANFELVEGSRVVGRGTIEAIR